MILLIQLPTRTYRAALFDGIIVQEKLKNKDKLHEKGEKRREYLKECRVCDTIMATGKHTSYRRDTHAYSQENNRSKQEKQCCEES